MSIKGYKRGIPTYTTESGETYGMLCETKEKCITDDEGVSLETKLSDIKRQTEENNLTNGGEIDGDLTINNNTFTETEVNLLSDSVVIRKPQSSSSGAAFYVPTYFQNGAVFQNKNADRVLTTYMGPVSEGSTSLRTYGMLGFSGLNKPVYQKGDTSSSFEFYDLLHTGNVTEHVPTDTATFATSTKGWYRVATIDTSTIKSSSDIFMITVQVPRLL